MKSIEIDRLLTLLIIRPLFSIFPIIGIMALKKKKYIYIF